MTDTAGLYQTPFQSFIDFLKMISVALVIAMVIRSFLLQPYFIPSSSMLNTLQEGDRLFVTKFSYGIHLPFISKEIFTTGEPAHGDIIVFPFPNNPSLDYIKRVVGLPGDVIEVRHKQLYRNGQAVHEDYVIHQDPNIIPSQGNIFIMGDSRRGVRDNMAPVTVPAGKVFVMGDNRDGSEDSRFWGFVDKDTIHGRALIIFWSSTDWVNIQWNRIGNMLR